MRCRPNVAVMMLPGEGYLRGIRRWEGCLPNCASTREIKTFLVVGLRGLRTSLEVRKMWFDDQASRDGPNDDGERVRENMVTTLQPLRCGSRDSYPW